MPAEALLGENLAGETLPSYIDHEFENLVSNLGQSLTSAPGQVQQSVDDLGELLAKACDEDHPEDEVPDLKTIRERAIVRIQELTPGQIYDLLIDDLKAMRSMQREAVTYRIEHQDRELERTRYTDRQFARTVVVLENLNAELRGREAEQMRKNEELKSINAGLEIQFGQELEKIRVLSVAVDQLMSHMRIKLADLQTQQNTISNQQNVIANQQNTISTLRDTISAFQDPHRIRPRMNAVSHQLNELPRRIPHGQDPAIQRPPTIQLALIVQQHLVIHNPATQRPPGVQLAPMVQQNIAIYNPAVHRRPVLQPGPVAPIVQQGPAIYDPRIHHLRPR